MTAVYVAIAVSIVVGAVSVLRFLASPARSARRALRGVPRLRIGEVKDNVRARIVGTVRVLEAPLTSPAGRRCVYFHGVVEQRFRDHKSSHWRVAFVELKASVFVVEDETGRALVDGVSNVEVAIDPVDVGLVKGAAAARELARQHGRTDLLDAELRYREAVIEDGATLAVIGRGVVEPDPDARPEAGGYRDAPPTRLRLTGSQEHPLVLGTDLEATTAP